MFGITPSGFNRKTTQDVQDEVEADLKAEFGASIRLARTSIFGQLVAVISSGFGAIWELVEVVYYVMDPMKAEGAWLDGLAKIRSITRQAAVKSVASVEASGTDATVITAGAVIELDGSGARFVVDAAATVSSGAAALELTAVEVGPTEVPAGSSWTIITTITGWDSVANAAAGTTGRDTESDSELRARLRASRGASGSGTLEAILARVKDLDGVTSAQVIENDGTVDDAAGRPPGSFEVLISGGLDASIAQTIWEHKPAAIKPVSAAASAPERVDETVIDSQGLPHLVSFTRPTDVVLWIKLTLDTNRALSVDELTAVKTAVVDYGSTLGVGDTVISWRVLAAVDVLSDVDIFDVAVLIDDIDPPVSSGNYVIAAGERPLITEARIDIVEV